MGWSICREMWMVTVLSVLDEVSPLYKTYSISIHHLIVAYLIHLVYIADPVHVKMIQRQSALVILLHNSESRAVHHFSDSIIAVGPGGVVDGKEVTMQVKVGQTVIYSKYAGTEVKLEDETYIIVKQSDILAIVE